LSQWNEYLEEFWFSQWVLENTELAKDKIAAIEQTAEDYD
jgi:hypothetical protein